MLGFGCYQGLGMRQQFNTNRENQERERFLRPAQQPLRIKMPCCEQTRASQFPHQDAPLRDSEGVGRVGEGWGQKGEVECRCICVSRRWVCAMAYSGGYCGRACISRPLGHRSDGAEGVSLTALPSSGCAHGPCPSWGNWTALSILCL